MPPLSHTVINVPIKPLDVGQLLIRARVSGNSESQDYLSATSNIIREGYEIVKSTVLMVDLTTRPYFVDNLRVPIPIGYNGTNVLTLTEGIVGPIVPTFPFNISGILGHPEVCNWIFVSCVVTLKSESKRNLNAEIIDEMFVYHFWRESSNPEFLVKLHCNPI